jgi:PleD family two-component response regulator
MNVLIVEQSHTVANKLSALLGKYGFEPHVARCGQDAFEMLKDIPVELLCFGSELGDMGGIDFFVSAKAHKLVQHQPGLLIASSLRQGVIERASMLGVTECFIRHDMDELERFIERFAVSNFMRINGRVLLVEGSDSSAMLYRQILERMGLQIEHC